MAEALLGSGKIIWELVTQLISGYEREKANLFVNHVEPLQQRMLQVHKDYIAGFEEVEVMLKDVKTTSPSRGDASWR
jgi:hypothetical protein